LREWAEKGVLGSWALQLKDNAADSTENWEIYEEEKSGEDLWLRACLGEKFIALGGEKSLTVYCCYLLSLLTCCFRCSCYFADQIGKEEAKSEIKQGSLWVSHFAPTLKYCNSMTREICRLRLSLNLVGISIRKGKCCLAI